MGHFHNSKVEQNKDIVDILNSKKAKDFAKVAKNCDCTFEYANAITRFTIQKIGLH